MTPAWVGRLSLACLIVSGGMLALSTLCLCIAGQMVTYFLVAAAVALLPFGYGPTRRRRLVGLGLVPAGMALAAGDHDGGVRFDRQRIDRLTERLATRPE